MADAANIDPNTGRPIIQMGQKAVKKTMEVSPDGRPVIQLRPQAAAAAVPDGGSFFVSVGSSVTDQSVIDLARRTNERLSQLNLAKSTFTFYGPGGQVLGVPVTGAETIAKTPAILLPKDVLPSYGLSPIQSFAYHTSGLPLVDAVPGTASAMRVLKGQGISGNYPQLLQMQEGMEQAMRSGDQAISNAKYVESFGSAIFVGAEPISANPARLTSVVSHEFIHNLTSRGQIDKTIESFGSVVSDLARRTLDGLQEVPAAGINPGFKYDLTSFFDSIHTPYKMYPNYSVGEVVDFLSTAVGESFIPKGLEEGRADTGAGLVASLLKRNKIVTDADLDIGTGFRSSLMSRYGNPLGFARNYGSRIRSDIEEKLTLHPSFKNAPEEIISSTINEILEQGSHRGSIEYLTSVGFSDELMGVAKGEFTTEVENLLLSIDPTASAENPRIKSFMDQFTEAQKRNMGTSMTIDQASGDRIAARTIDYGSIDEIAEGLRTRIASGSKEIQAQIKGVQATMEEARSVFVKPTSATESAANLAFDAPSRRMRSGPSSLSTIADETSAAVAAGTRASRKLGARAVTALRATNAGRLFR
jgi:hypothetical protein